MKYVFLDIDGVLNSTRSALVYGRGMLLPSSRAEDPKFDPVAVGLLWLVVEQTKAKIVISSSWRIDVALEQWGPVFDMYGWNTRDIIIAHTPDIPKVKRGHEIYQWQKHNMVPEDKYAIIDDVDDCLDFQRPHFVKVNPYAGLSVRNFLKIKKLLSD